MTPAQVAANAAATRWLAGHLEAKGFVGDTLVEAEHIVRELLALGVARAEVPPPLRPTRPAASDEARARYVQQAKEALDARRAAR